MHSQERFTFFAIILLHLQQPTVPPLPEEGSCIGVFTALSAHVQLNVLGADGATELWRENICLLIHTENKIKCHERSIGRRPSLSKIYKL